MGDPINFFPNHSFLPSKFKAWVQYAKSGSGEGGRSQITSRFRGKRGVEEFVTV